MKKMSCLFCSGREGENLEVLYRENLDFDAINERIFSARRAPDRYHYRIVKCKKCGLVFANPILREEKIEELYLKSKFTYGAEVKNLRQTYGNYLTQIKDILPDKKRILEIGCGNGFFLEEAIKQGFKEVFGVEPSIEAVRKSFPAIRKNIISSVFKDGLFQDNYFDIICFFQTLDHIVDPNKFLKHCLKILKKDGLVFCITHNSESVLTKILGERSPIFDIEHIYLFNKKTLRKLFEQNRFKVIDIFSIANQYSLEYWIRMLPFNRGLKRFLEEMVHFLNLQNKTLRLNVGNIAIIAKK